MLEMQEVAVGMTARGRGVEVPVPGDDRQQ
jgi:hypothetical protein